MTRPGCRTQRADELARHGGPDAGRLGRRRRDSGWLVRSVRFDPWPRCPGSSANCRPNCVAICGWSSRTVCRRRWRDPTVLTPIVTELVNNAVVRYTAQLGLLQPALGRPAGPRSGHPGRRGRATTVFIRVCDRGIGIDPTDVERAFERFWRAGRDTDGRGGAWARLSTSFDDSSSDNMDGIAASARRRVGRWQRSVPQRAGWSTARPGLGRHENVSMAVRERAGHLEVPHHAPRVPDRPASMPKVENFGGLVTDRLPSTCL